MPHSCSPHRPVGGPIPTRCVVVPRQCQSPTVAVPSGSPHSIGGRAGAKPLWGRPHVAASEPPLIQLIVGRLQTQRTQRPASTKRDGCNGWVQCGGCNGWVQCSGFNAVGAMRCEGKRTRALGLGPTRFCPNARIGTAQSTYPFLSFLIRSIINMFSQSTFVATVLALVSGTSLGAWVSGNSQKRHQSNPRLPVPRF